VMDGKAANMSLMISNRSFMETILADLERQILDGRLAVGDKLPSERQLAERYGASRTVVREALRSLAERRLVAIAPGRGTFVSANSTFDAVRPLNLVYMRLKASARQLTEARVAIEGELAALAAKRATREDLDKLRTAFRRLENSTDPVSYTQNDLTFHRSIARAACNPVMEAMFNSIAVMSVEPMLSSLKNPESLEKRIPHHRAVYEAIERGDSEAASDAMRSHLSTAEQIYGSDYDQPMDLMASRRMQTLLGPGEGPEGLLGLSER